TACVVACAAWGPANRSWPCAPVGSCTTSRGPIASASISRAAATASALAEPTRTSFGAADARAAVARSAATARGETRTSASAPWRAPRAPRSPRRRRSGRGAARRRSSGSRPAPTLLLVDDLPVEAGERVLRRDLRHELRLLLHAAFDPAEAPAGEAADRGRVD